MNRILLILGVLILSLSLNNCSFFGETICPAGATACIGPDGKLIPPKDVPKQVRKAIDAANEIAGKPYRRGGGHAKWEDSAYDCSGSVSYVLYKAGMLVKSRHSSSFLNYSAPGPGKWITVYTQHGHSYMTICGVRFDTGGGNGNRDAGPKWHPNGRDPKRFVARHPRHF